MSVKVELGFTEDAQGVTFFTLDDPVKGVLDNTEFLIGGGEVFRDVSEFFISYNTNRGKSRELGRYDAGQASVNFQNRTRAFDPTFEDSPFFGQIVPKRQLRISVDDEVQYLGIIQDWNIAYDPGGQSIASAQALDSFSFLSGLELEDDTFGEELSSARVNRVLNEIGWSPDARDISTGRATLEESEITDSTNALQYLQLAARSEPSDFFISKSGDITLLPRNIPFSDDGLLFAETGGIPYKTISVIYGSELLYNRVTTTSTAGEVTESDITSITTYGERDFNEATLLSSTGQLRDLADALVSQYAEPELRIEGLTIDLRSISPSQRTSLLGLELGDIVQVQFTPNDIPPAIDRFGKVIGITQTIQPGSEEMQIRLQDSLGQLLRLDDAEFGKLDSGNRLGF